MKLDWLTGLAKGRYRWLRAKLNQFWRRPSWQPDDSFDAFLSHSSHDKRMAFQIQRTLERFVVPKKLVGKAGRYGAVPRCIGRVFVDRSDFSASPHVFGEIEAVLARSKALVVLCSKAAASPTGWVNREIETYRRVRADGRIFAIILRDDPPDCFPPALMNASAEPLAADMRPVGDGPRDAVTKLIAGIIGVDFDDLRRKREQARRRARLALAGVVGAYGITVTAALLGVMSASYRLLDSHRAALADAAKRLNEQGKFDTALLMAAAALPAPGSSFDTANHAAEAQAVRAMLANRLERVVPIGPEGIALFDPHNERIYVASYGESLRALSLDGRDLGWHFPPDGCQAAALSNDGRRIAYVSDKNLIVLDGANGSEVLRTAMPFGSGRSVAFAPFVDRIVVGAQDGRARVFDLATHGWTSESPQHKDFVTGVAFSIDGQRVLSGSFGASLLEWNAETGALVREFENKATVNGISTANFNSTWIVTYALQRTVTIKNNSFPLPDKTVVLPNPATGVALLPGKPLMVAASWAGRAAYVVDTANGEILDTLSHPEWVDNAYFLDQGRKVVSIGHDGVLRTWRVSAQPRPLFQGVAGLARLALTQADRQLLIGDENILATIDLQSYQRRDLTSCKPVKQPATCRITTVAVTPDGGRGAYGTADGRISVLDLHSGQALWAHVFDKQAVLSSAFAPDDRIAALLSGGSIQVLSRDTGEILSHLDFARSKSWDESSVAGIAFDPTGAFLVKTWEDGLSIIRFADGKTVWSSHAFDRIPVSVAWSPDGALIAAGTADGTIRVFQAFAQTPPVILRGGQEWVYGVSFSPNSKYLISTSDNFQLVWYLPSGDVMMTLPAAGSPSDGVFIANGEQIATINTSGLARTVDFPVPDGDVKEQLCAMLPAGRTHFAPREMLEFRYLDGSEQGPCEMPAVLSWKWLRTSVANWLSP
jgi:WD40 repeat protein